MQITRNVLTISDINSWYEERTLIINKDYQREGGIWVLNARTYFIDTILNGFPFPKVSIRQIIDLKTRKSLREIIDGQQRIMTINSFVNGEFALTSVSKKFKNKAFGQLTPEEQQNFLAYEVSVDMLISATEDEVLEIFRRMNSYMLPLNDAEKRHAEFQGEFKWFIKTLIENYTSSYFEAYNILTKTQITRMADADLLTELVQVIDKGIMDRKPQDLYALYKEYDKSFPNKEEINKKFTETMNFIKMHLYQVSESRILNQSLFYSLFAALILNKYGLPNLPENLGSLKPINSFVKDEYLANENILELLSAFEKRNDYNLDLTLEEIESLEAEHPYAFYEFVQASSATTHRIKQRMSRVKWMALALRDEI